MAIYSKEFKESLVKKILTPPHQSIRATAKEANIGISTLYGWVCRLKSSINIDPESVGLESKRPSAWTAEQRLNALLATANLTDETLSHYCRQHGLYKHQLNEWRQEFMTQQFDDKPSKKQAAEIKRLQEENKKLSRDLRRKEKALAEASALLILKKKADLIWGVDEDD